MIAECTLCGTEFETESYKAKWCSDRCRKRHERGQAVTAIARTPAGRVADAVRIQLEEVDGLDSPLGAAALVLAERIDGAGGHADTGSALASLVRELRTTLAAALDAAPDESNVIDDLIARRAARRAHMRGGAA